MNAEFIEKMLKAKRLEAEAFALLVPADARRVAAVAVRACSDTVLEVLETPESAHVAKGEAGAARVPQRRSGLHAIDID